MSDDNKKFPQPELSGKQIVPTQEFGLLRVFEFPDGTHISINLEKGRENLRIHHSSGSYTEVTSEGSMIQIAANNAVNYSKGGISITIDNSSDTKGAGHARISLGHDAHIEVGKNASIVCNGRADVHSTGHLKLSAADLQLSTSKGSLVFAAERDIEFKAKSRILMHSGAVTQITSDADIHVESAADAALKAGGTLGQSAGAKITQDASDNIEQNSKKEIQVFADQAVVTFGKESGTKLQKGGPVGPKMTIK